jgi:hypothetical protein
MIVVIMIMIVMMIRIMTMMMMMIMISHDNGNCGSKLLQYFVVLAAGLTLHRFQMSTILASK